MAQASDLHVLIVGAGMLVNTLPSIDNAKKPQVLAACLSLKA